MDAEILIPIAMFGGLFGTIVVSIVAKTCARVMCHWRDVSLKMRMIEEGFHAPEIEQVMNAGRWEERPIPPRKAPPRRSGSAKELV